MTSMVKAYLGMREVRGVSSRGRLSEVDFNNELGADVHVVERGRAAHPGFLATSVTSP